jgi:cytochrome c553
MGGIRIARGTVAVLRAAALAVLALGAGAAAADERGDPARGATRADSCAACHGAGGATPIAGMPALAGQQREFLVLQLILMREGLRDIPEMSAALKDFTDRDIEDVASYFSRQPPFTEKGARDPARGARGGQIAEAMGCNSCHMGGYTGQRQVPRITNQREDYLVAALKAYRDNRRSGTDTSMNAVMYQATDADIAALAHYLAHR